MTPRILLLAAALVMTACSETAPEPQIAPATEINWPDLLPDGEAETLRQLQEDLGLAAQVDHFGGPGLQIGTFNVEQSLIGERIRMPGFILPLDIQTGNEVTEFLLVPYMGACVHTPPPAPNQIVYVRTEAPIVVDRLWDPVWVTGVLSADRHMNELGDAAYTLSLETHEPYEM